MLTEKGLGGAARKVIYCLSAGQALFTRKKIPP
jgi:hypothetical protein